MLAWLVFLVSGLSIGVKGIRDRERWTTVEVPPSSPTPGVDKNFLQPDPTVQIDSGPLVGTTTILPSATAPVIKFLGVPFADKPKRFEPPVKKKTWKKPRKAQKWKPSCIQQFNSKIDSIISSYNYE
jgi:hypothetical protein